jgi:ubiquinone/menaquinone biosynthesis C-methylase UbiE
MLDNDPTCRFSNRVENYIKYRPGYPLAILEFMTKELGLTPSSVIADVGSGTGILSRIFLNNGNRVYGIEPNEKMREAAEDLLKNYWKFVSIATTAEATTLKRHCVHFITAAQAFHWFDIEAAKVEFKIIQKPGGWVVLIWNERKVDSPFLRAYEDLLLELSIDYQNVDHRKITEPVLTQFYGPGNYKCRMFKNHQLFDFSSLKGRMLSSSYAPTEDHPNFKPLIKELEEIFTAHQKNGNVRFEYDTKVYYGQLK